jgi:catechol 2,3-dioxygenase-like lactoylglutathione lyase family enzyme
MREALARAQAEIEASFATARASRVERSVGPVKLVVAVCDGHPSEIADAWGKESQNTVFALYDAKSLAVSLRRSPDCTVDLSRVGREPRRRRTCGGVRLPAARAETGPRRSRGGARGGEAPVNPALTHVAFGVQDLDRTIAFYRKHVRLHVVHEREEHGTRVVWLGERTEDPAFVLVFFQVPGEPSGTLAAAAPRLRSLIARRGERGGGGGPSRRHPGDGAHVRGADRGILLYRP